MPADSVGQEFGQSPVGWLVSIPQGLWLRLGRVESWGTHLEVLSLLCSVYAGGWLGSQLELQTTVPLCSLSSVVRVC